MQKEKKFLKPKQCFFLLFSVFCVYLASHFIPLVNQAREEYRLTHSQPLENAPPELIIANAALGGLRGLLIDYLWMHALKLRDEGRHYEIIQLYDWIGKLEPRITEVWSYTSWEMSYNIAATMPSGEERWRWVYKGIEQLRDFGLKYNPNNPVLYYKLAWIFLDKIGIDSFDEYRFFYQNQLISMMENILGQEPNLEKLANAPQSWEDLNKKNPNIALLWKQLEEQGFQTWEDFFRVETLSNEQRKIVASIVQNPDWKSEIESLIIFFQVKQLRENWKMFPAKMLALEKKYGKLDWRLAASHALYWIEEGIAAIDRQPEWQNTLDSNNLDRLQQVALTESFEYGYIMARDKRRLICMPNFNLVPVVHQKFEDIEKKWKLEEGRGSHEVFLKDVVHQAYMSNRLETAKKYYRILKKKFPRSLYEKSLPKYIVYEVGQKIMQMQQRHKIEYDMINNLYLAYGARISGQFFRGERGENAANWAHSLEQYTKLMYDRYVDRHGDLDRTSQRETPLSFRELQELAVVSLKQQFLERYPGRGEKIWNSIKQKFPFLHTLDQNKNELTEEVNKDQNE